jgi:hypothetical protein
MSPSSLDYDLAKQLVTNGNTVVLVNGLAKDQKSIPADATTAYYLKPLTYNSQVAGYLIRAFPSTWTVLDTSGKVLSTYADQNILVPGTNTPDLRGPVKAVQQSVDQQAIRARNKRT